MQNRKSNGQYSSNKSGKAVIWLVVVLIIIGVTLFLAGDKTPSEVAVEPATFVQEIDKDEARVEEYLNSQEAKRQAKIAIYEKDKVEENKLNEDALKKLEADFQEAVRIERARHAEELKKINANLDGVRKEILQSGSTTVKGN